MYGKHWNVGGFGVGSGNGKKNKCILLVLVTDQLDAQLFSMYLFQFYTCFEQPHAHHQENQLYQYNL
jgi:hypothetical protein